jgi:hypothetical protein
MTPEVVLHAIEISSLGSAGLYALGRLFALVRDLLVARMALKCDDVEKVKAYAEVVAAQNKQPEPKPSDLLPASVLHLLDEQHRSPSSGSSS